MTDFGFGPRLPGKVAIVTGAGGGIGGFTARLFAAHGAKVVATDIDLAAAEATVAQIKAEGHIAVAVQHDVVSEAAWDHVIAVTVEQFGGVDILVNNAGYHVRTHMVSLPDITRADWDQHLAINLTGPFLGTQRAIPEMLKRGKGVIVNICSVAALVGGSFMHYSAAKAGLRSFTRNTAVAYGAQGIRANAVFPGLIETGLTRAPLADPATRALLAASNVIPHFGEPKDIAFGILYLASDESSFATGSDLILDGGVTAK